MNNKPRETEWEKEFLKWAEARDDDWWGENGSVSIWDVRIMAEFFNSFYSKLLSEKDALLTAEYERGYQEASEKAGHYFIYEEIPAREQAVRERTLNDAIEAVKKNLSHQIVIPFKEDLKKEIIKALTSLKQSTKDEDLQNSKERV